MDNHTNSETIDLRSDTKTRPCAGMREAIKNAVVGDYQANEDPTCQDLCERVAALLGKEAAVFLPTGTMCNQIAMRIHCKAGDEIICCELAHILVSEAGGMAGLSGATPHPIKSEHGIFTAEQFREAIRVPQSQYWPNTRLVVMEQTSNFGGGTIWPLEEIQRIGKVARAHDISVHMDGARLLNAVVASGISAAQYSEPFDSVWIDFTKGLGAPIGAVLAGSAEFVDRSIRFRQMFGGAFRQGGIAAAGCLYALEHNIEPLVQDHINANALARAINTCSVLETVGAEVQTNIVMFQSTSPNLTNTEVVDQLAQLGVMVAIVRETGIIRAVTHRDVTRHSIATACDILAGYSNKRPA